MAEKGTPLQIETLPLESRQDVRSERGTLNEVLERASEGNCHDFIRVTLTDEQEPYRMKEQLREVYDSILEIHVDNARTRKKLEFEAEKTENLSPFEAFELFYEDISKSVMSVEEEEIMTAMFQKMMEGDE